MSLQVSPITREQWTKVAKAAIYSFVSTAFVTWQVSNFEFSKTALTAAAVAGVNAALVAAKQLFTEG